MITLLALTVFASMDEAAIAGLTTAKECSAEVRECGGLIFKTASGFTVSPIRAGGMDTMSEQRTTEQKVVPCYWHYFLDDPCQEPASWKGCGTGNMTDEWTWCLEHAPAPEWREPLR